MADEKVNIQDTYLNQLRTSKQQARVLLSTGKELRGVVSGFDQFTFTLQLNNTEVLIYKSAVAIIASEGQDTDISKEEDAGDEQ